jgi:ABC-type multidrug transport system fused ATPase/permease subunit
LNAGPAGEQAAIAPVQPDGGSVPRQAPARKLRPLRALLPYVARYRGQVALALLFLLLAAGATLALPQAVKLLVDGGLVRPAGGELAERLVSIRAYFGLLFGVAVVLGLATAARFYMVSWIGERVTSDLRQAVYAHVLRQSPQFFETLKTGEVLSRLTTDTTVIHNAVGSSVSMGLRNIVLLTGGLTMLLTTTPRLMLIVAGIIVLVVLPAALIGRRVRKLSRASQDRTGRYQRHCRRDSQRHFRLSRATPRRAPKRRASRRQREGLRRPRSGAPGRVRRSPPLSSSASSARCSTACTAAYRRYSPAR